MKLIILRGLPGAGKSRYAMLPGATVVSTDQFFTHDDDEYVFDPAKIGEAHADCLRRFVRLVVGPRAIHVTPPELLVVDNTNTSVAEIAPYYALGAAYGYEVEIVELACDVETAVARNIHGVPRAIIEYLARTLEANTRLLPPWWVRRVVEPSAGV